MKTKTDGEGANRKNINNCWLLCVTITIYAISVNQINHYIHQKLHSKTKIMKTARGPNFGGKVVPFTKVARNVKIVKSALLYQLDAQLPRGWKGYVFTYNDRVFLNISK